MDLRDLLNGISPSQRFRVLDWLTRFFEKERRTIWASLKDSSLGGSEADTALNDWMVACKEKEHFVRGVRMCDEAETIPYKLADATFFFPLEIPKETAELIAKEVGDRCAADAETTIRMGNAGWFIDVKARNIRESDRTKIYPFLYGVEFALRRGLLP